MAFELPKHPEAFMMDRSTKRQPRMEDPAHLAFIRKLPSLVSGVYGVEACHIRYGSMLYRKKNGAKGMKPDDAWTVPLTPEEHREQHSGSEAGWWRDQGIDPLAIAARLYEVSGDVAEATRIILKAHGERQ